MKVELKQHQEEHFSRIEKILQSRNLFIDTSVMGSGKTYTTILMAKELNMDLGVVCPKGNIMENWRQVCKLVGVKLKFVLSYDMLRSESCPILDPIKLETGKPYFKPTEKFIDIISKPFMLVFDEFHKIKNKSKRSLACSVLVRTILRLGGQCRIGMLSASPYDKVDHIVNMMYTMGFIQNPKLSQWNPGKQQLELKGIAEAINIAKQMNRNETNACIEETESFKGKDGREFLHKLFIRVFKPALVSSMPPPIIESKLESRNAYYSFEKKEHEKPLLEALGMLEDASSWKKEGDWGQASMSNYAGVCLALKALETAKLPLFIAKAKEILEEDDYAKVVIFVNFLENLENIRNALEDYGVVDIQGKLSTEERVANQQAFQEPNSNVRVIIGTTSTGGVGINLHDTDGRFPRTMLITPNYDIINLHQATGRIYRVGTKSHANVKFIYGKVAKEETKIIDSLVTKSKVMKEFLDKQVEAGVKFPSDYETEE